MITQERLKELFSYDKETGNFTVLKNRKGSSKKIGCILGSKNKAGYLEADIDGKRYYLHRLAFLYVNGMFPDDFVDHKNRKKCDNSWSNLRDATPQQNVENDVLPRKNGSLGYRGVYKVKNKFYAKINHQKKQIHLGTYSTPEEASIAYLKSKPLIHLNFHQG